MTITLAEAQTRLRALAAERPDYVYPRPAAGACVYFNDDGTPSCIVGHALEQELRAAGIHENHGDNASAIGYLLAPLRGVEREALRYLAEAQAAQDSGTPWGMAVELADDLAEHGAL